MQIEVKEADGDILNVLVEKALGLHVFKMTTGEWVSGNDTDIKLFSGDELTQVQDYTKDGNKLRDIIDEHEIWTHTNTVDGHLNKTDNRPHLWEGVKIITEDNDVRMRGPNHAIAALRTFVAWKLGYQVEL